MTGTALVSVWDFHIWKVNESKSIHDDSRTRLVLCFLSIYERNFSL